VSIHRSVDDPARSRARDAVRKRGAPRTASYAPRPPQFRVPHTVLAKLLTLLVAFPPPVPGMPPLSPRPMGWLVIVLHLKLQHASFWAWVLLSERLEEASLDPDNMRKDAAVLLGYAVCSIARTGPSTIRIVFTALDSTDEVALEAPAGEGPLQPFPLKEIPGFIPSARFLGLLTSCRKCTRSDGLFPPAPPT
jgi:hypothetical protein